MLCSKCYQKIPQGEEMQIKGSVVCEKCGPNDLESIGKCNGCFKIIYKDEVIHEVYENWGAESSEKLIKCQDCYKEWLKIAKSKRKIWEMMRWFENSFLPLNMWLWLAIVTFSKNEEHVGRVPFFVALVLIITNALLSPLFFALLWKIIKIKYRNKKRKQK